MKHVGVWVDVQGGVHRGCAQGMCWGMPRWDVQGTCVGVQV